MNAVILKIGAAILSGLIAVSAILFSGSSSKSSSDASGERIILYVATDGSDANDGSIDSPFATLEAARDAIRTMSSSQKKDGVTVYLRGGTYYRIGDTFRLEERDSGTDGAPIVYSAYPGEKVVFSGSITVEGDGFTHVEDEAVLNRLNADVRDKVMVLDLGALGYTKFAPISQIGRGRDPGASSVTVSVDGDVQTLSRYPNSDFISITTLIRPGFIPRNHAILLADGYCVETCHDICKYPRSTWWQQEGPAWITSNPYLSQRAALWEQETDVWTQGYYMYEWAEDMLHVNVSADGGGIRFEADTPTMYGAAAGRRYYVMNLLCEIDMPGEFYLDRENAKLYLYPKNELAGKEISMSLNSNNFITMENASFVSVENLSFIDSNTNGIQLIDCTDVLIAGCDFFNLGNRAVMIGVFSSQGENAMTNTGSRGGFNNSVLSCNIKSMGQGGVYLGGGNRYTLSPGNNQVVNCDISDFSVIARTSAPAVEITGCGDKVLNNRIYNAPHYAILYFGNNHIMRNNEIFDVLQESGDSGVFYAGRSWTYQGNVIDNNYIADIPAGPSPGTQVFFLDDMASGTTITNNLLVNISARTSLFAGGHDIVFRNNIMGNGSTGGGMKITNLVDWGASMAAKPGGVLYVYLLSLIINEQFDRNAWTEQYPTLMAEVDREAKDMIGLVPYENGEVARDFCNPANISVTDNIFVGAGADDFCQHVTSPGLAEHYNIVYKDNDKLPVGTDIGFENVFEGDFDVKEGSLIEEKLGKNHFDRTTVGLYDDEYRNNDPINNPFTDVLEGKWYTKAVLWCFNNGYMVGTSDTTFEPNASFTRAMFVTVLAKIAEADTSSYTGASFTDVPKGKWYSKPIEWAFQNGLASGLGDGKFGPNDPVTREMLAQFLYNYSKKSGYDTSASADVSVYPDAETISKYARKAVFWAVGSGLISGVKQGDATYLAPKDTATRAQVATIVRNYVQDFVS